MATARVAGRYAESPPLAQERNELDAVGQDLNTLEALFEGSRDLVVLLQSPIVKGNQEAIRAGRCAQWKSW